MSDEGHATEDTGRVDLRGPYQLGREPEMMMLVRAARAFGWVVSRLWATLLEVVRPDDVDRVDDDPVVTSPFGEDVPRIAVRDDDGEVREVSAGAVGWGHSVAAKVEAPTVTGWGGAVVDYSATDPLDLANLPQADPVRFEIRQSDVDATTIERFDKFWWCDGAVVCGATVTVDQARRLVNRWERFLLGAYGVLDELEAEGGR